MDMKSQMKKADNLKKQLQSIIVCMIDHARIWGSRLRVDSAAEGDLHSWDGFFFSS